MNTISVQSLKIKCFHLCTLQYICRLYLEIKAFHLYQLKPASVPFIPSIVAIAAIRMKVFQLKW